MPYKKSKYDNTKCFMIDGWTIKIMDNNDKVRGQSAYPLLSAALCKKLTIKEILESVKEDKISTRDRVVLINEEEIINNFYYLGNSEIEDEREDLKCICGVKIYKEYYVQQNKYIGTEFGIYSIGSTCIDRWSRFSVPCKDAKKKKERKENPESYCKYKGCESKQKLFKNSTKPYHTMCEKGYKKQEWGNTEECLLCNKKGLIYPDVIHQECNKNYANEHKCVYCSEGVDYYENNGYNCHDKCTKFYRKYFPIIKQGKYQGYEVWNILNGWMVGIRKNPGWLKYMKEYCGNRKYKILKMGYKEQNTDKANKERKKKLNEERIERIKEHEEWQKLIKQMEYQNNKYKREKEEKRKREEEEERKREEHEEWQKQIKRNRQEEDNKRVLKNHKKNLTEITKFFPLKS